MGRHNVLNAMVALAVADENGVPLDAAVQALEQFTGFQNRQQIMEKDGITVIDDTYNASPVSMIAGLEVLHSMEKAGRRIAVLADMKELGPEAPGFHRQIGWWLAEHPVDLLFTLGELAEKIAEGAQENGGRGSREFYHFSGEDREGLYQALFSHLKPGDCVLLKGSNSMKLGQVAARLLEKQEK